MQNDPYEIRRLHRLLASGHYVRWELVRVRDGKVLGEYASRYDAEVARRSRGRIDPRG